MPNLGQLVKTKRESSGLSQKRLGQACGISDSEIMKIENGVRKKPSWDNLCRIAQALDFHPFEVLLAAGYISELDIHPSLRLKGIDKLDGNELLEVQNFINFTLSKKSDINLKEEL